MDQAQLLSIIGSVYDKFVADVSARVGSKLVDDVIDRLSISGMLTTEIDTRIEQQVKAGIDQLTASDMDLIRDVVRDEIDRADVDEQISDWMGNNFDIDDHLDLNDKIDDYLSDRLSSLVKDEVQDLSFSVTVD